MRRRCLISLNSHDQTSDVYRSPSAGHKPGRRRVNVILFEDKSEQKLNKERVTTNLIDTLYIDIYIYCIIVHQYDIYIII